MIIKGQSFLIGWVHTWIIYQRPIEGITYELVLIQTTQVYGYCIAILFAGIFINFELLLLYFLLRALY